MIAGIALIQSGDWKLPDLPAAAAAVIGEVSQRRRRKASMKQCREAVHVVTSRSSCYILLLGVLGKFEIPMFLNK